MSKLGYIMKISNITKFLLAIVICQLAGLIGGIFTTPSISGWYATLQKPSFNPPNWVFGPVWIFLFLLMGISLYLILKEKLNEKKNNNRFIDFYVSAYIECLMVFSFFRNS